LVVDETTNPKSFQANADDRHRAIWQVSAFPDARYRTDRMRLGRFPDFLTSANQDYTERFFLCQALADHQTVAILEDVQRQNLPRKKHSVEWKEGDFDRIYSVFHRRLLSRRDALPKSYSTLTSASLAILKDSVPPGVGEIFAVLVGGRARVMRRASPPPLRVRFRAGAAVPWAFTRPKQRDS
jgi:hypothetical protein